MEIISYLTDGALKPIELVASYEALADLMTKHPRLALEEVRQAFDFSTRDEADKWLNQFVDEGRLIKEEAGTSYFVRLLVTLLKTDMTRNNYLNLIHVTKIKYPRITKFRD